MDIASYFEIVMPILEKTAFLYAFILPHDLARYLVGAGGVYILVNLLYAKGRCARKIRPQSPKPDQMKKEFWRSMRTTAIFSATGTLSVILADIGVLQNYDDPAERGWLYFAFNIVALVIMHDAWFYWTHRIIHHPALFRRAHGAHHKSKNPSPWTAYSFDVAEAVVNALFLPAALAFMATSHLAIFIFLAHMIIRNAVGHCGYELFPADRRNKPLFDWITTVTHHDLHHEDAKWNFGLYFTFWDRVMGTEHPQYHQRFAKSVDRSLKHAQAAPILGER